MRSTLEPALRWQALMTENRARTIAIQEGFTDEALVAVHEPTMGPAHWDLGHIAHFEELWLLHGTRGEAARRAFDDATWDAEQQPRPTRASLDIPARQGALQKLAQARERTLAALPSTDVSETAADPLVRGGFLHRMILMHEMQHQENILITASLVKDGGYTPTFREEKPGKRVDVAGMARIEGGEFPLGRPQAPGVYDNESPQHVVHVPTFHIDKAPVTNRDYLAFIDAGGYDDDDLWSEDGADLKGPHRWRHPKHWQLTSDGLWMRRAFDRLEPLDLDEPVVHVSYHEAEAYAAWAGKRLPTEVEWEKAATWDPRTGTKRTNPWGEAPWTPQRANLDQRLFGPSAVGSHPEGVSATGCHQMLGDVWEWTSSVFTPYPGFSPYPYDEYSVPFFDRGFQVLRGGSWATRPLAVSATFRNWHQSDHQQLFAGFRCARGGDTA